MESKREQDSVTALVKDSESTMDDQVTKSVAKVFLRLESRYPLNEDDKDLEKLCERIKAASRHYFPDCPKYLEAIDKFKAKAQEPLTNLDQTTWVMSDTQGQHIETLAMPLSKVLAVVWKALEDSSAFTHHYLGNNQERLLLAKGDFIHRLQSLLNCFKDLNHCHQYWRHLLIFDALNQVHCDVNILENASTAIIAFVKDWLSQQFWQAFSQKPEDPALLAGLWAWMEAGNAEHLCKTLNLEEPLFSALTALFLQHGSDFNEIMIGQMRAIEWTQALLRELAVGYDAYPGFQALNVILGTPTLGFHKSHLTALMHVRDWIKSHYRLSNPEHQQTILTFERHHALFALLHKHFSLLAWHISSDELESYWNGCLRYFASLYTPSLQTLLTAENCTQGSQAVNQTLSHNHNLIENFFARFYDDRTERQSLYLMLWDTRFYSEVTLKDEDLQRYLQTRSQQQKNQWVIDISRYQINRFFLHAIINPPATWTPLFTQQFADLLDKIEQEFNQSDNTRAQILTSSHYPEPLLQQMAYLLSESPHNEAQTLPPQPPAQLIRLPEHCTSVAEVGNCLGFLAPKHYATYFKRVRINDQTFSLQNLAEYGRDSPINLFDFLKLVDDWPWVQSLIKKYSDLTTLLQLIPWDQRVDFLKKLNGWPWVKGLIKNRQDLISLMDLIPREHQWTFLEELKDVTWVKNWVKDYIDLLALMRPFSLERNWNLLVRLDDWCRIKSLIKNRQALVDLLELIPVDHRLTFLEKLNDWPWIKRLIKNEQDLTALMDWIRLKERNWEFLQRLNDWPWLKQLIVNLSYFCLYFPVDKRGIIKSKLASDTVIPPNRYDAQFFSSQTRIISFDYLKPSHIKYP